MTSGGRSSGKDDAGFSVVGSVVLSVSDKSYRHRAGDLRRLINSWAGNAKPWIVAGMEEKRKKSRGRNAGSASVLFILSIVTCHLQRLGVVVVLIGTGG
mmetsp:Transcript_49544/g.75400  ORF Transcript_49544/g.75400 Transcript_49544/m.75400 type:complete len:99 (-) Transcript_49544:62-358(-)